MICTRTQRRVAIPLLWILLILKVYSTDAETAEASLKSEIHDCFRLGANVAEGLEKLLRLGTNFEIGKVKLFMRSRKMNKRKDLMKADLSNLKGIDFDPRRKTYFIIHGYIANSKFSWMIDTETGLLQLEDANVISVDWDQTLLAWNYLRSVGITDNVGKQIATFLEKVAAEAIKQGIPKESWGKLHLIGHSLGAHISGCAASELKKRKADWQVHRITGLDPAKPCFDKEVSDDLKLDRADAPFIDIIHANADKFLKGGLGLVEPIGHFDFYANEGKQQPGCTEIKVPLPLVPLRIKTDVAFRAICSHNRVNEYFVESIQNAVAKSCKFWAEPWDLSKEGLDRLQKSASCDANSCVEMGINSEAYYKGNNSIFYVPIDEKAPYCVESPTKLA